MTIAEAFLRTLEKLKKGKITIKDAHADICQTFLANRGGYYTQVPLCDIKSILSELDQSEKEHAHAS